MVTNFRELSPAPAPALFPPVGVPDCLGGHGHDHTASNESGSPLGRFLALGHHTTLGHTRDSWGFPESLRAIPQYAHRTTDFMRGRHTDYDRTPYDALAADHRAGADITQRLADLIVTSGTRPGEMARRLNRAGVPVPSGGRWEWPDVSFIYQRERERRSAQQWTARMQGRTSPPTEPHDNHKDPS